MRDSTTEFIHMKMFDNFFMTNHILSHTIIHIYTSSIGQLCCDSIIRNRSYSQQELYKKTKCVDFS